MSTTNREFLRNYKTFLGKEEALRKVIDQDLQKGLVSRPFSESDLGEKYNPFLLNSSGAEIKELSRPDVITLADATQGGANRHILLTMHPTSPSLADTVRISDRLSDPAEAKWGRGYYHRRAITPEPEHGMVATMGPDGIFCANTVGAFLAVSAGRNWDRISSEFHMWDLNLVGGDEVFLILSPDGKLFLAGNGIFGDSFVSVTFFLIILGYHSREENYG